MKQIVSLTVIMALAISSAFAKDNATSKHEIIKSGDISISYGRPSKSGRTIFAANRNEKTAVISYGQFWRPGDNEGSEITFSKDCVFAGHPIKAGTYTLIIQSLGMEWMIVFNSQLGQKGTFNYDKVKANNVMAAAVGVKKTDKAVENFTMAIQDGGLLIAWDKESAFMPITFSGQ